MIDLATKYLGIGTDKKLELFAYYNQFCYPLVPNERKYRIRSNDDWCACFTSVIAHKAGLRNFPFEVSCYYQYLWGVKNKLWRTADYVPKPNDLIYFDWGKGNRFNHVGFVVSVKDGVIKTIEGNKNKTVANRFIKIGNKSIKGFISLNYQTTMVVKDSDLENLVMRTLKGEFGNGDERKQKLGDKYEQVQKLINSRSN